MCINGLQQDIILDDGQISNLFKHINICTYISDSRTLDQAIKGRTTQGGKATAMPSTILWNQKITTENKHLIYNVIIESIQL